jgi:hypothetical protein
MGPEDDDDRGGGGAECEAYHSRSNDTWTAGIRSHAAWAALSAQTPCILWALVLSSKTLRVRKSELSLSARYDSGVIMMRFTKVIAIVFKGRYLQ